MITLLIRAATRSGSTADYEDRNWGFRFARSPYAMVANGIDLVWRPWQVHAENYEYELRHGLIPEKIRRNPPVGLYQLRQYGHLPRRNRPVRKGLVSTPDITNHPWHVTRKYGFGINLEQNLTRNLTAFGRFGWDNGKTESFAYTEVDQTFAWGSAPMGVGGIAAMTVRAWLSSPTEFPRTTGRIWRTADYGFLMGDGGLNYGRENILETYYTAHVWRGIYLAPGLQRIVNPGYNRDRGPVIVPSFRLHLEF